MANGDIITNLDDVSGLTPSFAALHSSDKGRHLVDKVDDGNVEMSSPGKGTWIARTSLVLPALFLQGCMGILAGQQDLITKMIREWIKANGTGALPPELAHLAVHAGIKVPQEQSPPGVSPPCLRCDKRDKVNTPPKAALELVEGALKSKRFVLTRTWPNLGGRNCLELGKDKLKAMIEDSGGSMTKAISCLTNALVVGDNPGPKMVQEAHKQNVTIVDVNQLKDLMYPTVAVATLSKSNIQV
jgi:NAD-dependent DNA ligase